MVFIDLSPSPLSSIEITCPMGRGLALARSAMRSEAPDDVLPIERGSGWTYPLPRLINLRRNSRAGQAIERARPT
jgi:hypothetical protein